MLKALKATSTHRFARDPVPPPASILPRLDLLRRRSGLQKGPSGLAAAAAAAVGHVQRLGWAPTVGEGEGG